MSQIASQLSPPGRFSFAEFIQGLFAHFCCAPLHSCIYMAYIHASIRLTFMHLSGLLSCIYTALVVLLLCFHVSTLCCPTMHTMHSCIYTACIYASLLLWLPILYIRASLLLLLPLHVSVLLLLPTLCIHASRLMHTAWLSRVRCLYVYLTLYTRSLICDV